MPRKRKAEARAGPEPESASAPPEIKEDAGTGRDQLKKVRTNKRRTSTPDEAQTLIGEVFVVTSFRSPVKAYRVVGLTKTSKSALLESVPVLTVGQDRYGDGSRKIDRAFLDQHPVCDGQGKLLRDKLPDLETKLILVSKPSDYSKTLFERAHFNFGECAYCAKDLDRVFRFVEY